MRAEATGAVDAIDLSRRTHLVIRGSLFWACAYNCAAPPLAAAGLPNPTIAAGARMAQLRLRGVREAVLASAPRWHHTASGLPVDGRCPAPIGTQP